MIHILFGMSTQLFCSILNALAQQDHFMSKKVSIYYILSVKTSKLQLNYDINFGRITMLSALVRFCNFIISNISYIYFYLYQRLVIDVVDIDVFVLLVLIARGQKCDYWGLLKY